MNVARKMLPWLIGAIVFLLVFLGVRALFSRQQTPTSTATPVQVAPVEQVPPAVTTGATTEVVVGGSVTAAPAVASGSEASDYVLREGCQSKGEGISYEGIPYSEYVIPAEWVTPDGFICKRDQYGQYNWHLNGVKHSSATWKVGYPYPKPSLRPELWP